jgi:Uma2 family endonuclease
MAEPALILPKRDDGRIWPAQGEWTYEDYLRLPDDGQRYEVIWGHLYVTPPPDYRHQFASSVLVRSLGNLVHQNRLGVVLGAPFGIRLPREISNPVEPDVIFFRTGNLPGDDDKVFSGVPDLVIEILSPSTRRRDEGVKLEAYLAAGVPEYWLVDPKARTVRVHRLEKGKGYAKLGCFGMGETVQSPALPELRLEVAELFVLPE